MYVKGSVDIRADLNALIGGAAQTPGNLVIYAAGDGVSFAAAATTSVSALIYAPLAACGNDPATTAVTNYFGSLVCDTISVAGAWTQQYDESALAHYADPVPGVQHTYAPGVVSAVTKKKYTPATFAASATCTPPVPGNATGYWKLDESTGQVAADMAAGAGDAAWQTGAHRVDGVCGLAAQMSPDGYAVSGSAVVHPTHGASVEFWAKIKPNTFTDTLMSVGGYRVQYHQSNKIQVTDSATGTHTVRLPFTVQNSGQWHLYTITVSDAGEVVLYIDGAEKGRATDTSLSAGALSGALTLAKGPATGAVDEAAYIPVTLSPDDVAAHWLSWFNPTKFDRPYTTTDAGTPFSAPRTVTNGATTNKELHLAWEAPTGTFPVASTLLTNYQVEELRGGTWTAIESGIPASATSVTHANPTKGDVDYRVCAVYNGDRRCADPVRVFALDAPPAPTVTGAGPATLTAVPVTWTEPSSPAAPADRIDQYQYQYRIDGGDWQQGAPADALTRTATVRADASQTVEVQARAHNPSGWPLVEVVRDGDLAVRARGLRPGRPDGDRGVGDLDRSGNHHHVRVPVPGGRGGRVDVREADQRHRRDRDRRRRAGGRGAGPRPERGRLVGLVRHVLRADRTGRAGGVRGWRRHPDHGAGVLVHPADHRHVQVPIPGRGRHRLDRVRRPARHPRGHRREPRAGRSGAGRSPQRDRLVRVVGHVHDAHVGPVPDRVGQRCRHRDHRPGDLDASGRCDLVPVQVRARRRRLGAVRRAGGRDRRHHR